MDPLPSPPFPALDDVPGWRAHIRANDETIEAMLAARVADAPVKITTLEFEGVRVFEITPLDLEPDDERVYLDIHGGSFIYGAGDSCRTMAVGTSLRTQMRVWAVDYRMPPDHPYPAGLDDCVITYRALLAKIPASKIIVGGASAGGNLVLATMLRARAEGLALPAGLVLLTPGVDLTESGDSVETNLGLDPLLTKRGTPTFLLYAQGHDLRDPFLSPIYGDFSGGFPPVILTTGTRDLLLSDTVRMHRALRAAGVEAELHVTEAAGHGGFFGLAPEDHAITDEIHRFIDRHT